MNNNQLNTNQKYAATDSPRQIYTKTRITFLKILGVVLLLLTSFYYFPTDLREQEYIKIFVDIIAIIFGFVLVFLPARIPKLLGIIYNILLSLLITAVLVNYSHHHVDPAIFALPMMAFFLLNRKGGIVWSAIGFITLLIGILFFEVPNLEDTLVHYFGIALVIYFYQKIVEIQYSTIEQKNQKLKQKNDKLHNTLVKERELEKDLKKERDRIRLIISSMGEGLLVIDKEKRITMINPAAQKMLEVPDANEVLGKEWNKVVSTYKVDEKTPVDERSFSLVVKNKETIVTHLKDDHYYVTKSGNKFPVSSVTAPLRFGGEIVGAVKVFRDESHQKEIDQMKTDFISIASHQLRTPLSAMKWFIELVLDESANLTDEQKDLIDKIYTSNERIIKLVNSLLNISRIESGRIIIDPEPTDLKELVESVISELEEKINQRNQKLIVSTNDNIPEINIDPKLIRHVYMNILTNAMKYSPDGSEITIIISKDDEKVISQVSDKGYGIPKEQHDRVFTRFFRADNVIKKETDGTGLGLYLVKAVVESSGGEIWFESKEGEGTTFWFSLPLEGSKPKSGEVRLDTPTNKKAAKHRD